METIDYRIVSAREFLASDTRSADELTPLELQAQVVELRGLLRGALEVSDDYANEELDQQVTQVTADGGVYFCPEDVRRLCPECLSRLAASS